VSAADATRDAHRDLARLSYPPEPWVLPHDGPDGRPLTDVLVVGGGMIGQTAAFALRAEGIARVRVIDRAAPGREGPWVTFARMPTLRSPKHVNGPDLGIPSLTYRAWHEAQFGAAAWDALGKIDRALWHDYLAWVRAVVGVVVESRTALTALALDDGAQSVRATLQHAGGASEEVHARAVVLCLGRGPEGRRLPDLPSLPAGAMPAWAVGRVWHSSDDIDFAALRGARVAVVGAGASGFDNAATALEAGAARVALFARRAVLPRVNYFRALATRPWQRGYPRLPLCVRWELFTDLASRQVPPPPESVARCAAFPNFALRLGEGLVDVAEAAGGVTLVTTTGASAWDAVILATGFDRPPLERAELAGIAPYARTWADEVGPDAARANPTCARYPVVGPGYELLPRSAAAPAGLARVHAFDWSALVSLGPSGGDIPGLELGAARLAAAIAGDLFLEDEPAYRARLFAYADS